MRIISGMHKGRKFQLPKNLTLRPTTDFAKEGLFNVIRNLKDIEGAHVLDLFTGTGSIALEFISRGAASVLAVDMNEFHCKMVRGFIEKIDAEDKAEVFKADVFKILPSLKGQFDIVFADPPYEHPKIKSLPDLILQQDLLNKDAIIIIEHPREVNFESHSHFIEQRKYGAVHFSIFQKIGD